MPEEKPATTYAMYITSHGKRKPGRQRKSYLHLRPNQIAELAGDRKGWRRLAVACSAVKRWQLPITRQTASTDEQDFTCLWRWLSLRLSKRQSPTRVLFRTNLTRTINSRSTALLRFMTKSRAPIFSTNQMQNQNQSLLGHTRFPSLGAGYLCLLWVLIGSFCCLCVLWLVLH